VSIIFGHCHPSIGTLVQVRGLAENGLKIFPGSTWFLSYPPPTIEHMLPASLFAPLDLSAAVEESRRTQGAHGVVDLLVVTLTDRRLRSDAVIDEHLAALKSACRQTRRYREALPVLHRVAALNPDRRHEMAAEIAMVHAHLGEHSLAVSILETAIAQQRRLPAWKRSLAFCLVAEVVAYALHRPDLAGECAELGWSTATPAPKRTRATSRSGAAARTVKPATKAGEKPREVTPNELAAAAVPASVPTVGRRRAKGPVRQLSVLSAGDGPVFTDDIAPAEAARPLLTVVGGTAA